MWEEDAEGDCLPALFYMNPDYATVLSYINYKIENCVTLLIALYKMYLTWNFELYTNVLKISVLKFNIFLYACTIALKDFYSKYASINKINKVH